MPATAPLKPKAGPATQRYLDIAEIRDDMVIMSDGTVRAVMLVSSINFALKSNEEQEAIVQAYITFLNGLEYAIQIVIQSRRMNIDAYLQSLVEQQRTTTNDLLRGQIADYRTFVGQLVELGEIMQKRFYVVVPYDPLTNKRKGFFSRFQEALSPVFAAKLSDLQMDERRQQLSRRTEIIAGEFLSMGLQVARLDTQGLIELYYDCYNPDVFEAQRLGNVNQVGVEG